jgi:hypothetical protein
MIAIPIAVQSQCEALQTRAASLLVLASERVDALAQHLDAWSAKRERWELLRSAPDATFGTLIEDNSELETGEIRARLIAAHAERCVAAHRAAQVLVAALVDDAWTQCVRLQSELDALIRTHVAVPTLTLAASVSASTGTRQSPIGWPTPNGASPPCVDCAAVCKTCK